MATTTDFRKEKKKHKSTEQFKATIKAFLDEQAENDPLFANSYMKEGKNIDDCCTYVLNTVKKLAEGANAVGLNDDEVYNMAMHYYDEDKIDIGKDIDARIVVNHQVQLTEEEIEEEKEKARKKIFDDTYKNMHKKKEKKSKGTVHTHLSPEVKQSLVRDGLINEKDEEPKKEEKVETTGPIQKSLF